jgi:hypothetical protein
MLATMTAPDQDQMLTCLRSIAAGLEHNAADVESAL